MNEAVAVDGRGSSRLGPAAAARLIALLLPAALLAGAFGSQVFGGLFPCGMCWWQRYAHMAALVPAVLAFTAPALSPKIGSPIATSPTPLFVLVRRKQDVPGCRRRRTARRVTRTAAWGGHGGRPIQE